MRGAEALGEGGAAGSSAVALPSWAFWREEERMLQGLGWVPRTCVL